MNLLLLIEDETEIIAFCNDIVIEDNSKSINVIINKDKRFNSEIATGYIDINKMELTVFKGLRGNEILKIKKIEKSNIF